jgi:catechol 2,3-dioxygenase-like lactoylglutathione lyase family enzyme
VPSAGYWLYLADQAVIHLVQSTADERSRTGTGVIHHIAFRGIDLAATRRALVAVGVSFREAVVHRDNTVQLFVHDPDGVAIELNFDRPNA